MSKMSECKLYIDNKLINDINELNLTNFFKLIHSKYYNNIDISFMEYFIKLLDHDGKFYIHHNKLIDYGIMTSTESSKVKKRLNALNLIENEDYLLADVGEQHVSGIKIHKDYYLTPDAFKLCLIRAQMRANQPINPKIYAKYYLLLEKMFNLYNYYQNTYQKNLNNRISKENKLLHSKVDALLGYAKETKEDNKELLEDNKELLADNRKLFDKIDELDDKVEEVREGFKEILDDVNPKPSNVDDQHAFIVLQYQDDLNRLKIHRCKNSRINKLSLIGMTKLIDHSYNPNPIDMFNIFKSKVKEIYQTERENIINNYNNKLITRTEKKDIITKLTNNKPISINYNTVIINPDYYNIKEVINIILSCDQMRFQTPIP